MNPTDSAEFVPPSVPPLEAPAPRPPWGFWSTVGLGLIALGVMIAVQSVVAIIFGVLLAVQHQAKHGQPMPVADLTSNLLSNPLMLGLSVFVSIPAVLLVLWAMIRLRRGPSMVDYLGLRGFRWRQFLIWGGSLIAVLCAGNWLISFVGDDSGAKFIIPLLTKGQAIPLIVAALVIGAPLVEEVLFRGFMYRGMAGARWAPLGAIVIPNLFWVMLHVQYRWPTVLVLFAMGLVLGGARHFSKSTVLPFTLHLLSNAASVCMAFTLLDHGTPPP